MMIKATILNSVAIAVRMNVPMPAASHIHFLSVKCTAKHNERKPKAKLKIFIVLLSFLVVLAELLLCSFKGFT